MSGAYWPFGDHPRLGGVVVVVRCGRNRRDGLCSSPVGLLKAFASGQAHFACFTPFSLDDRHNRGFLGKDIGGQPKGPFIEDKNGELIPADPNESWAEWKRRNPGKRMPAREDNLFVWELWMEPERLPEYVLPDTLAVCCESGRHNDLTVTRSELGAAWGRHDPKLGPITITVT